MRAQKETLAVLEKTLGSAPNFIIIDYLSTSAGDLKQLWTLAESYGYHVVIQEPNTSWHRIHKDCLAKTKLSIAEETMMRIEKGLSGPMDREHIMASRTREERMLDAQWLACMADDAQPGSVRDIQLLLLDHYPDEFDRMVQTGFIGSCGQEYRHGFRLKMQNRGVEPPSLDSLKPRPDISTQIAHLESSLENKIRRTKTPDMN